MVRSGARACVWHSDKLCAGKKEKEEEEEDEECAKPREWCLLRPRARWQHWPRPDGTAVVQNAAHRCGTGSPAFSGILCSPS